jgi:glycosyltransferase involved in cell wall biosynthesis
MNRVSRISVVLPNFNHSHFVGGALRALLSQSPAPDEIIIVDDASTDNSRSIIEDIAVNNPSIQLLVNSENIGVIRAQKRGLEVATGRYIYLAAADDWVMQGFFALALQMLEKYALTGFFCGDAIIIDGQSGRCCGYRPVVRPFYRARAADVEETRRILRRCDNWILTGSTVFRRDAFEIAGGLDETLGTFADGYLARKVALASGFCYAPKVVAAWRIFSYGVSRQASLTLAKATDILQTMPTRISNDPLFPEWYPGLFRSRWRFASSRLATQATPINYAVLESMFADSTLDARMLKCIRCYLGRFPSLERLVTLVWLAVRLRPYPLSGLMATRLSRWGARFGTTQ